MASREDQDWQMTKKTVLERNQFMFNNSLMSDIQFTCGEGKRKFYAHKYVLATTSPVFFAMFYGSLDETKSEIHLSDTVEDSLETFLCFIYTDDCQLTPENAVKVMYLAKKYMVPSLTEKCVEELKKGIKAENVATILEQTLRFDEKELSKQCWEIVELDTSNVITSKGFNEISQETLISLLKRESLNVSEVELFQAVLKWSDNQCLKKKLEVTGENRRIVLGGGLYQISFFSMTIQHFTQHVVTSGILSSDEIVPIYATFCEGDTPSLKWEVPSRKKKLSKSVKQQRRFVRCSASEIRTTPFWQYTGDPDSLCFNANKTVYFNGVRLFGDFNGSNYTVLFDIEGVKTSGTYTSTRDHNGVYGFDVMLPEPFLIEENKTVTITATIKGPQSYCVFYVKNTSVTVEEVTLTFSKSSKSPSNGTGVSQGQFYEIILSI